MTRNELIAAVALDFINTQLDKEPEGSLRFCMVGLEASLVVSVAKAVLANKAIGSLVSVKIAPSFDRESNLPASARSDESITHWRHCRLPEGKRAVLFAASQEELQRNDKSVEKITKLETDSLRGLYQSWIINAGLTTAVLEKQEHLKTALAAVNETYVARTIESFADFVLSTAQGTANGLPLQKSIDNALPSLRLPKYSGYFDRISDSKRNSKAEWAKIFRRLHSQVKPLLVRETERGESITDKLEKNFEELKPLLNDEQQTIVRSFINADLTLGNWTAAQQALVEQDWRTISGLFEGINKTASPTLGDRTIKFFDDEFDDQLDDDERSLLAATLPKEPSEDLQQFFETHREHLSRDKRLSSDWEKYIYRNPQTYQDFLVGLIATLQRLRERTGDDELTERKLKISIAKGREKSFWRTKNPQVARYLAFRYRGLESLLGDDVELSFGKLHEFYFPDAQDDLAKSASSSRDARTVKFEVALDPEGINAKMLFIWEMPVDAVATSMAGDLLSIAALNGARSLLPTADVTRQSVSAKGGVQRISLDDVNTIRDVANGNDGRMVAPNKESGDRSNAFHAQLSELERVLDGASVIAIRDAFDAFHDAYSAAIRDWITAEGKGIAADSLIDQATAFGTLLAVLNEHANNDLSRDRLWKEVLRIGVANVGAGSPAAIVLPWHPLRLAEIAIKARQTADLVQKVLSAKEDDIYRADLLFSQVQLELLSNYYPEVCVGYDQHESFLLAAADTRFDYTLCELPQKQVRDDGEGALDVDPVIAARAFGAVGEHYLKLLPHEQANFSMVLFNAESKALPSALAAELSSKVEKENELQCDLLLTHSDPQQMRRIYEQQNVAVSEESGSLMASEAARNFLSRLRVGFLDAADASDDDRARAADIVALQDVIARNAKLVWKRAPGDRHPELSEHFPARWSRRRPVGMADRATAVYLAAPTQPLAGQRYLNAIHTYLEGDNALDENVIPAREVNFKESEIGEVFKQTHRIGEWVVNFDELVDRRLLTNNGVQVIRHIHDRDVDRNIIVSTTSKPRLLRVLLEERLNMIDPGIIGNGGDEVVDRLISQANGLSGQVVMRAARYGRYANELLGIVLSMEQIKSSLGGASLPIGWYFLDDYASWFGQREEQIADIMAIAPRMDGDEPVLMVALAEAKFVRSLGYKTHARKSAKQLEETAARISRALDPGTNRIDRDIWLHRLGDFMIEGMDPFDATGLNGWDLHRWSDEVRQGKVTIKLAGFSHVFVHDDDEYVDGGGSTPLKNMEHCVQEVFDKPRVAAAFRHFSGIAGQPENEEMPSAHWGEALRAQQKPAPTEEVKPSAAAEDTGQGEPDVRENLDNSSRSTDTASGASTNSDAARASKAEETVSQAGKTTQATVGNNLPEDTLRAWPSRALAEWVSSGKASDDDDEESRKWLEATVTGLQRALRGYDMTAELKGARLTPNAALVRFRGSDDLTVPKVEKRRQELLTSHAINVINVLAAPMEVVIMVARPTRAVLRLQDLWCRRQLPASAPDTNTSLLLGAKESDGELLYLNVGEGFAGLQPHGPHTLIAGETGSGKGVLVQCLLLDICATNAPSSARIKMIDPKAGIDFPWLRQMPHLHGDLITERENAIFALEELVAEMERRNRLLAEAGVTKLSHYNRRVDPGDRLPRIWLFHDELADWMMIDDYRDAVELNASRLGVKARAAGINLVLVTQRPDKDALPMQLRANLTNRLVLKVADKKNSILVLDEPGAERLLGRGHLAAKLSGEPDIILTQVPFAGEEEISELSRLIRQAWASDR
jgi:S-DNA-T family DNA segregation ATPase FtsK/SpoIIIE